MLLKQTLDSLGNQCVQDIHHLVTEVFYMLNDICEKQKNFNIKITDTDTATDINETKDSFICVFSCFHSSHKTLNGFQLIQISKCLETLILKLSLSLRITIQLLIDFKESINLSAEYQALERDYNKARVDAFTAFGKATDRINAKQASISDKSNKWADMVEEEEALEEAPEAAPEAALEAALEAAIKAAIKAGLEAVSVAPPVVAPVAAPVAAPVSNGWTLVESRKTKHRRK